MHHSTIPSWGMYVLYYSHVSLKCEPTNRAQTMPDIDMQILKILGPTYCIQAWLLLCTAMQVEFGLGLPCNACLHAEQLLYNTHKL